MQFHYKKDGALGRITMVNPPSGALVDPVFAEREELSAFFADPEIKAVVLEGQGRHFCSGADPKSFTALFNDAGELQKKLTAAKMLLDIIRFAPVPVLALIRGSCLGAGLEIALACHFRFAAASAMFGFPETQYGLMPGMGGTILSGPHIGRGKLMELVLGGRMIGAEEALQIGLVDRLCAAKTIDTEVMHYLGLLTAQHSSELVRMVMQSIHNGCRMKTEEALEEETRLFCRLACRTREEK